jgi:hypothetical protein
MGWLGWLGWLFVGLPESTVDSTVQFSLEFGCQK